MADPVPASLAASVFDDYAPLYRAAGFRVVPIAAPTGALLPGPNWVVSQSNVTSCRP